MEGPSFVWWYKQTLEGVVKSQTDLQVEIRRLTIVASRVDMALAVLAVAGTATVLASLEELLPGSTVTAWLGAIVNIVSVGTVSIRNQVLTPAKQGRLFDLLERIQDFAIDLNHAILNDDLEFQKHNQRRDELERRILELVPSISPSKAWDNMTEQERQQRIERSFPA